MARIKKSQAPQQPPQTQCPEGCCTGDEILCISIPCPISIVLLGLDLQLELPCIRLSTVNGLTAGQTQQILGVLANLLGALGSISAAEAADEQ
ncbi:hypothetical protein [Bacillus sp. B-jedd]|uniref:hypothetical protein n=1 Tax=Bacillus sp. B-jedd TaxID=1476857 RepID=UPI00051568E6|nr:hypothetical protein [Bacillus sp. B-jedd]CEG25636.1 hypothetical protein BN1002_00451 [Bacillus sp. B-jedd]